LAYHTVQLGALFARRKGESILFQISTLSTAPCRARLSCSSVGSPYATCSCHISCAPFSNSRSSFWSQVWLIPSCRAQSRPVRRSQLPSKKRLVSLLEVGLYTASLGSAGDTAIACADRVARSRASRLRESDFPQSDAPLEVAPH
jgi:hypothetical protein